MSALTEEDIRSLVVNSWLTGHGIQLSEISLEFAFEVQLGRNVWKVDGRAKSNERDKSVATRPRSDVLVRRGNTNLMIIEVKGPNEPLDDHARNQGISYARLLPQIAPFVVVTNGRESKLFDAVTTERIDGHTVPLELHRASRHSQTSQRKWACTFKSSRSNSNHRT